MQVLLGLILTSLALFLILIILVQRGRGGGLSGALGGMGGQSAFGTKAGDAFTKITIAISIAWIVMCIVTSLVLGPGGKSAMEKLGTNAPAATGTTTGGDGIGSDTSGAGDGAAEVAPGGDLLGGSQATDGNDTGSTTE